MPKISYSRKALKVLDKLSTSDKRIATNIKTAISNLQFNPYPNGCKKMKDSNNEYRIRVGDYRIIYTNDMEVLAIINIGHRREIYQD